MQFHPCKSKLPFSHVQKRKVCICVGMTPLLCRPRPCSSGLPTRYACASPFLATFRTAQTFTSFKYKQQVKKSPQKAVKHQAVLHYASPATQWPAGDSLSWSLLKLASDVSLNKYGQMRLLPSTLQSGAWVLLVCLQLFLFENASGSICDSCIQGSHLSNCMC